MKSLQYDDQLEIRENKENGKFVTVNNNEQKSNKMNHRKNRKHKISEWGGVAGGQDFLLLNQMKLVWKT